MTILLRLTWYAVSQLVCLSTSLLAYARQFVTSEKTFWLNLQFFYFENSCWWFRDEIISIEFKLFQLMFFSISTRLGCALRNLISVRTRCRDKNRIYAALWLKCLFMGYLEVKFIYDFIWLTRIAKLCVSYSTLRGRRGYKRNLTQIKY